MTLNKIICTKGIYEGAELDFILGLDENNQVLDFFVLQNSLLGRCYEATVEKIIEDIGCAFVILKTTNKTRAFLKLDNLDQATFVKKQSQKKAISQGDIVLVKITKEPKNKKPYGCEFCKSLADNSNILDFYYDKLTIKVPIEYSDAAFDGLSIINLINKINHRTVYLSNGSNIVIEHTEALTVIDVNSGKNDTKKDINHITNKLAAVEIARQIRLRNISGMIIIDFINCESTNDETELISLLKDAVKDDYCKVEIHKFTALGLLEITRERIFSPIYEQFKQ